MKTERKRVKEGKMKASRGGEKPEEECDGVAVKVVEWPSEGSARVARETNGQRLGGGGLKGGREEKL